MGEKIKISGVIIARNEENKISDCLESVRWLDEVILINDHSEDSTVKLAKNFGARIINASDKTAGDYSSLRNIGLQKSRGEWIFYIDADERVTPELTQEISNLIKSPGTQFNAFAIPRKNIVLGQELKHGGFGDYDYVKRLFRKKFLNRWVGKLHEEPEFYHKGVLTKGFKSDVGHLKNKMIHLKAATISEMVEKTNKWSEVEAGLMLKSGHPPMNIIRFLSAMLREFWSRFVKHRAYLDGQIGVIHGLYQVFSRFLSYAKLWEMQMKSDKE